MDKIAIISDVHANITALEAVIADIKSRGIERIFCLGDSIIKCANPDLVVDRLREVCEVMIIGNSDYAICRPEVKNKNFWTILTPKVFLYRKIKINLFTVKKWYLVKLT